MKKYYDCFCKCGCGNRIEVRWWHKYKYIGIPKYLRGHNRKGKKYIHKSKCQCLSCKLKRGEPHRENCQCTSCRSIRGEYKGENAPNWRGGLVEVICLCCGKKYEVDPWQVKISNYCSRICKNKDRKNRYTGSNSPNWRGGTSFEPYPIEWTETLRESIRERDNYTCQLCGKTQKEEGKRLSVHHIDYVKENLDLKNLITLCRSCNSKINSNQKYWTEFFSIRNKK